MIKITILTLFPDFIDSIRSYGVLGKAIEKGVIELEILNIRDFSKDKHNKVDDEIYGGGAGMLMTVQPVFDAIKFSKKDNSKVFLYFPELLSLAEKEQFPFEKYLYQHLQLKFLQPSYSYPKLVEK